MRKQIGVYEKILAAVAVSVFGVAILSPSASAATIPVDDVTAVGSPVTCNLQSAIESANTNTAVNGCVAGDPMPAVDTIELGNGAYQLAGDSTTVLSESTNLYGVSSTDTTIEIVLPGVGGVSAIVEDIVERQFTLRYAHFTITSPSSGTYGNLTNSVRASVGATIYIDDVVAGICTVITVGDTDSHNKGSVSIRNSQFMSIEVVRNHRMSSFPVTIQDTRVETSSPINIGIIVDDHQASTQQADNSTLVERSNIQGQGGSYTTGIRYYNPRGITNFTLRDSIVTGYSIGISVNECSVRQSSGSTTYVENSMIGGGGMNVGAAILCGHYISIDTTYHDIVGSAVTAHTNTSIHSSSERGASRLESYNSTYTRITPGGTYDFSSLANQSAGSLGIAQLTGVVTIYTTTSPGAVTATGSELIYVHNTFANNTLGTGSVLAFDGAADLATMRWRNNAMEGSPRTGSYTATADTVSDNLTTGVAQTGIAHVSGFVLGALADNGGVRPLGVNGTNGHVLTMRPLATSPLIDGAPSADLTLDQRHGPRSVLGAYDVGAVEVSIAEYLAGGGVWPRLTLAQTGTNQWLIVVGVITIMSIMVALLFLRAEYSRDNDMMRHEGIWL